MKSVQVLKDRHKGEIGYIVGKGPSILKLKGSDFGPGPIITINHAIHYVEELNLPNPVYSMQKDGCDINERGTNRCEHDCKTRPHGSTGMGGYPKKAALLLCHPESWFCYPDHPQRYLFNAIAVPSLPCAASIIQRMGVKEVKFLCCDAIDGEAMAVWNNSEVRLSQGVAEETMLAFYQSNAQLAQEALDIPLEWVSICND